MTPAIIMRKGKDIVRGKAFNILYLDETSRVKQSYQNAEEMAHKIEQVKLAMNYLSKEEIGKIYPVGYFRSHLQNKYKVAPENLDNATKNRELVSLICKQADEGQSKNKIVAHRFIVSLSSDFRAEIERNGYITERIIGNLLKHGMEKIQKQYHKNDQLGYAYGIHHDTDNIHVHVVLSARTKTGQYVAFSDALKNRKKSQYQHVNVMSDLKDAITGKASILQEALVTGQVPKMFVNCHTHRHSINMPTTRQIDIQRQIEYKDFIDLYNNLNQMQSRLGDRRKWKPVDWLVESKKYIAMKAEYLKKLDAWYVKQYLDDAPPSTRQAYYTSLRNIKVNGYKNSLQDVQIVNGVKEESRERYGIAKSYVEINKLNYKYNIKPQRKMQKTPQQQTYKQSSSRVKR